MPSAISNSLWMAYSTRYLPWDLITLPPLLQNRGIKLPQDPFGSTSVFSYSDVPCSWSELSLFCFPEDLHFPFLHFPLQGFFSPLQSPWSRLRNLAFQASKSASMLPCLLWATLQSPSARVMMRLAPSIHSHRSVFLPTWDRMKVRGKLNAAWLKQSRQCRKQGPSLEIELVSSKAGTSGLPLACWPTENRTQCDLCYHTYCVVMIDVHRVSQAKHSVSQALQKALPEAEIIRSLFQPLAEPGCALSRLAIRVRGYQEHTNVLAGCLTRSTEENTAFFRPVYIQRRAVAHRQLEEVKRWGFRNGLVVFGAGCCSDNAVVGNAHPPCKTILNQPGEIKVSSPA